MPELVFTPVLADLETRNSISVFNLDVFVEETTQQRHDLIALAVISCGISNHADLLQAIETSARKLELQEPVKDLLKRENWQRKMEWRRKKQVKSTPLSVSRACPLCFSAHPRARVALVGCGHVVCMACALQIENSGTLRCPHCLISTTYVKLQEECDEYNETTALTPLSLVPVDFDLENGNNVYVIDFDPFLNDDGVEVNTVIVIGYDIERPEDLQVAVKAEVHKFGVTTRAKKMQREEKKNRVKALRRQNHQSTVVSYCRQCPLCLSAHPRDRVVAVECGHVACEECVYQLQKHGAVLCPFCNVKRTFIDLHETVIEEEDCTAMEWETSEVPQEKELQRNTQPVFLSLD